MVVAFDPPDGANLTDNRPPAIEKLSAGETDVKPAREVVVPFLPQRVARS